VPQIGLSRTHRCRSATYAIPERDEVTKLRCRRLVNGYRVAFRREAIQHLEELHDYIADAGSPENAARYTEAIVAYCEALSDFPHRGSAGASQKSCLRLTQRQAIGSPYD